MTIDKVLIYQPKDVHKYARNRDGIERFLKVVTEARAYELQRQFKLFMYLRPHNNGSNIHYAGLMYLRDIHDKLDPLAQIIDGIGMIEGFRQMALESGANVLSAEFSRGRMEMEANFMEDYDKVWIVGLSSRHDEYKLGEPEGVNRFFLSLVPEAKDRIIAPYLESKGYKGRFQFVMLSEG